jgi:hypothetical protein
MHDYCAHPSVVKPQAQLHVCVVRTTECPAYVLLQGEQHHVCIRHSRLAAMRKSYVGCICQLNPGKSSSLTYLLRLQLTPCWSRHLALSGLPHPPTPDQVRTV